jgi:hypothetical protein
MGTNYEMNESERNSSIRSIRRREKMAVIGQPTRRTGRVKAATDPRAAPLPLLINDDGLAEQVQAALTSAEAWKLLGLPGDRDVVPPEAVAALAEVATALCATSDAIGLGLRHFGELADDEEPPASWVDRVTDLYIQELEGFWRLDDLAYQGLEQGGWTATRTVILANPAERIAVRSRWQAEPLRPKGPALWWDRLERALADTEATGDAETIKEAGRALVEGAARRRFAAWRTVRGGA